MLRPRGVVIDQELSSRAAPLPATVSALTADAQVIAECRAGNPAAWDSLFDKYYATVARFVFQLSGELSYDEIAAELRLNAKTVSSRLSKCLDRLLNIAKEIFPPDYRLPSNL